jgi:hypothetical protein
MKNKMDRNFRDLSFSLYNEGSKKRTNGGEGLRRRRTKKKFFGLNPTESPMLPDPESKVSLLHISS